MKYEVVMKLLGIDELKMYLKIGALKEPRAIKNRVGYWTIQFDVLINGEWVLAGYRTVREDELKSYKLLESLATTVSKIGFKNYKVIL